MNKINEIGLFIYKGHQNIILKQSVDGLVSDIVVRYVNLIVSFILTLTTLPPGQDLSNSRAVAWLLLLS